MLNKATFGLLLLTVCYGGAPVHAGHVNQKVEKITGTVIAYYQSPMDGVCYHLCVGTLLVRIDKSSGVESGYIRVHFRYPVGKYPQKLISSKRRLRFKLVRHGEYDKIPFREFIPMVNKRTGEESDSDFPAWRRVPGAEAEKLPFGEAPPSYFVAGDVTKLGK